MSDSIRVGLLVALIVAASLIAGPGVASATSTFSDSPRAGASIEAGLGPISAEYSDGVRSPNNDTDGGGATIQAADHEGPLVIRLRENGTDAVHRLSRYGVRIDVRTGRLLQAWIPPANRSTIEALPWVADVRRPRYATVSTISEGVGVIGAARVHETGLTGEGVTVGIIDVGFDADHPEIADNVLEHRSYPSASQTSRGIDHGTGVSEIVVDTAPDADLYLAGVGTMVEFADAVNWMIEHDVDVISVSLGWYGVPQDGTSLVSRQATKATQHGIVFVAAAGNAANRHWQDPFTDPDGDDWTSFDADTERNYLNGGQAFHGSIDIVLTWDDWTHTTSDYDLYLFNDSRSDPVAISNRTQQPGVSPAERISGTIPAGWHDRYYIGIKRTDASGSETLEMFSVTRDLSIRTASSSMLAPSVGVNITAVAASRYDSTRTEPFSSHGPTNDGRPGLDLAGPDGVTTESLRPFYGTSAAAPHVAGVVALMKAKNPALTREQAESVLAETATDMGPAGYDRASGYGSVNAFAAVQRSAADIRVTEFALSSGEVALNERVTIDATVRNFGLARGSESITLFIDGTSTDFEVVSLGPDETATVRYDTAFEKPGRYAIRVGDSSERTVSVIDTRSGHLRFPNQTVTNDSSTVEIASVGASVDYKITVSGANGTVMGQSTVFEADANHTDLAIELNRSIKTNVTLVASVQASADGATLASDTAFVTVQPVSFEAVYSNDSVARRYDVDRDGLIAIAELGQAAADYANGDIEIGSLGEVAAAYANS